jgi:hypothetical protein
MQKVVKFLEQNVQWVALGLGGLFFLYIVWAWVITPSATATIAGQTAGPGDVDLVVQDHANALNVVVNSKEPDPNIPKTPKDNVNDFLMTMSNANAPAPKLAATSFIALPFIPDITDQPNNPNQPRNPNQPPQNPQQQVASKITGLPELPAAEIVGAGGGLSSIQPPPNVVVAVVPVAAGGNPQPPSIDKAWATVTFRLSAAAIAKSFAAVQVPQGTKSLVLQVEMIRQEQLPNGQWGPDTPVRGIPLAGQVPYPTGGAKGLEFAYRQWGESHESDILQPPFYTVLGGSPWLPPGLPTVATTQQQAAFDPANYTGSLDALPPDQRAAVLKARHDRAVEKARNAPKAAPRGGGGSPFSTPRGDPGAPGGRGGGGGGNFAPPVSLRPQPFSMNPDVADNPDNGNPYGGSNGAPPPPGLTPEAQQMVQKHPNASFDPADPNFAGGIVGWAHDDNVEPGKTYRYKLHYKMLNPGYVQPGLFVNGKLALQFDVVSPDTAWTQPVDVPAQTTFYVSRNPLTSGVPFDVFHWQNGQLHFKTMTVAVGDMIGGPEGDTDFTSGWTVADIRSDPRGGGAYVLLVDNNGKTIRRDFNTDSKNPKYIEFKAQVNANKPPTTPPPGNYGG